MQNTSSIQNFSDVADRIAATTKKTQKVLLVSEYLRSLDTEDAALAATFLCGRAFPQIEERVLGIGGAMLSALVMQLAGVDAAGIAAAYRQHGDLGGAAGALLRDRDSLPGISLSDMAQLFDGLPTMRKQAQKVAALRTVFEQVSGNSAKYLIKIITGDLRIGSKETLVEEAIARTFERPLNAVRRANMLTGDIAETVRRAAADDLDNVTARLFHPLGFMLATPAESAAEVFTYGDELYSEEKYDGIRAQVHKKDDRVKLFSRTLDEIAEFPELATAMAALPGDFILDGEILGWQDSRPLPFTQLQKRLGRKKNQPAIAEEIPVAFVAFDLLYRDDRLLIDEPLRTRRAHLERMVPPDFAGVRLATLRICKAVEDLQVSFDEALAAGHEGIVAKSPDSLYTPGRRGGSWIKLKLPFATLDVVVTAVEYGHGKRHKVLSDYTFAVRDGENLVNVGKAYSGLTDVEIQQLTDYFLAHTTLDEGWRKVVEPTVVLEVAFNNMQRSERHGSGYALRFPRIVRVRGDKPAEEIDTIDHVRRLYEQQTTLPSTERPGPPDTLRSEPSS